MDPSSPEFSAVLDAMSLGPDEARGLEQMLSQAPDDHASRSKLIGYYSQATRVSEAAEHALAEHVLWLIRHAPAEAVLRSPIAARAVDLAQAEEAWRTQLALHPSDAAVHAAAALFFQPHDAQLAGSLLARAKELDPSGDWEWREYPRGMEPPRRRRKTLEDLEVELAAERDERFRSYLVTRILKEAMDSGDHDRMRRYARDTLELSPRFPDDWNHGNGIYSGHTALGLLALADGDREGAVRHLLAAAGTPGSPQLGSFGPDLTLAQRLLDLGQRDAVIQFLEKCQTFWKMGRGQVHYWLEALRAGGCPDLLAGE